MDLSNISSFSESDDIPYNLSESVNESENASKHEKSPNFKMIFPKNNKNNKIIIILLIAIIIVASILLFFK